MAEDERTNSEEEQEPEGLLESEALELDPEQEPVIDDGSVDSDAGVAEGDGSPSAADAVEAGAIARPGEARRRRPSRRTVSREERRRRTIARRKRRRAIYMAGGSIIAAMLIFGLALPSLGNLGQNPSTDDTSAPQQLVGTEIPVVEAGIIEPGADHPPYSTVPATSGPRYANPASWGVHESQQVEEAVVQNLAIGAVVFNHNLTDEAQVAELHSYAEGLVGYPACYVVQPHSGVEPGTITMTSWGWTQQVDEVDRFQMNLFVADHRNKGLEFIDNVCGTPGVEITDVTSGPGHDG